MTAPQKPELATPHLVLLSGGIDSATALALTVDNGAHTVSALFVDYGQAAAERERAASSAVAAKYGIQWRQLTLSGVRFGAGEIPGRNAFLLHAALMALPEPTAVVILGIHGGTGYRDCTSDFIKLMQQSYAFHTDGKISLVSPFVGYLKGHVVDLARELHVPLELTYSCEAANDPCGECQSCRDREALLARP